MVATLVRTISAQSEDKQVKVQFGRRRPGHPPVPGCFGVADRGGGGPIRVLEVPARALAPEPRSSSTRRWGRTPSCELRADQQPGSLMDLTEGTHSSVLEQVGRLRARLLMQQALEAEVEVVLGRAAMSAGSAQLSGASGRAGSLVASKRYSFYTMKTWSSSSTQGRAPRTGPSMASISCRPSNCGRTLIASRCRRAPLASRGGWLSHASALSIGRRWSPTGTCGSGSSRYGAHGAKR